MKFNDEALLQVIKSFPGFENASIEFKAFDQLNYLMMFLINAINSLTLAEKFNKDDKLTSEEQVIVAHSLFRDAIMNYAKCFTAAESNKIRVDFNAVIRDLKPADKLKYKSIHEEIIKIRNSYIAHNLENDFELSVVAVKSENKILYVKPTYTIQTPSGNFPAYINQCELVQNYLISRIKKTLTKICANTDIIIEFG